MARRKTGTTTTAAKLPTTTRPETPAAKPANAPLPRGKMVPVVVDLPQCAHCGTSSANHAKSGVGMVGTVMKRRYRCIKCGLRFRVDVCKVRESHALPRNSGLATR